MLIARLNQIFGVTKTEAEFQNQKMLELQLRYEAQRKRIDDAYALAQFKAQIIRSAAHQNIFESTDLDLAG